MTWNAPTHKFSPSYPIRPKNAYLFLQLSLPRKARVSPCSRMILPRAKQHPRNKNNIFRSTYFCFCETRHHRLRLRPSPSSSFAYLGAVSPSFSLHPVLLVYLAAVSCASYRTVRTWDRPRTLSPSCIFPRLWHVVSSPQLHRKVFVAGFQRDTGMYLIYAWWNAFFFRGALKGTLFFNSNVGIESVFGK